GEHRARPLAVLVGDALRPQLLLQAPPARRLPPPAAREPGACELGVVHEPDLREPVEHTGDRRRREAFLAQPACEIHPRPECALEQLERGLAAGLRIGALFSALRFAQLHALRFAQLYALRFAHGRGWTQRSAHGSPSGAGASEAAPGAAPLGIEPPTCG